MSKTLMKRIKKNLKGERRRSRVVARHPHRHDPTSGRQREPHRDHELLRTAERREPKRRRGRTRRRRDRRGGGERCSNRHRLQRGVQQVHHGQLEDIPILERRPSHRWLVSERAIRHVRQQELHRGSLYVSEWDQGVGCPHLWFVWESLFSSLFLLSYYLFIFSLLYLDPFKTQYGSLSIKAYRLTPNLMELEERKEFTPEAYVSRSLFFLYKVHLKPFETFNCIHLPSFILFKL